MFSQPSGNMWKALNKFL